MGDEDVVRVDARIIRATEKAVLAVIDDEEVWIPQSVIHDDSDVWQEGDDGELVIQGWWARKTGLGD